MMIFLALTFLFCVSAVFATATAMKLGFAPAWLVTDDPYEGRVP